MHFRMQRRLHAERIWSARQRRRHPCEKGTPEQVAATKFFRPLLTHRFWAKHPAPFNKTRAGYQRRVVRRFVRENRNVPT